MKSVIARPVVWFACLCESEGGLRKQLYVVRCLMADFDRLHLCTNRTDR
nr:MAG TPA: hypothetical protein [Bacteriophage sp.]